ncbi:D-alanine--poly(phosphoribitol) ligase subunit DltC [Enterococcus sp. LJL120]
MNTQDAVLDILEMITGTDEVREDLNVNLFDEGLMDSLATVQLLVELEGQLSVQVPVSEFDRADWSTPAQIIAQVDALKAA